MNRIKEIKKELSLINIEIENVEKQFDFSKVDQKDFQKVWEKYTEELKPFNKKYNILNR